MHTKTRRLSNKIAGAVGLIVAVVMVTASSCEPEATPQSQERDRQQSNYTRLSEIEPAQEMQHPITRISVNGWIATWDEPGKLAYVYLQGANGELLGYYILEGLPVSYCVSLTPTYTWEDIPGDGSSTKAQVPAPAMDGVYYGGAGACNTYYGFDAGTGAYIEYTAGLGINVLLYDQPLPRQDVQPLGFSTIEDVEENQ